MNNDRRTFLISSAKTGCTLLCGAVLTNLLAGCDTVENGEPILNLNQYPELQKIGGAMKKRYSKLNNGDPILIIRLSQNEFAVYSSMCTHKGVEVKLPKNGEIVCPNHGSRFKVSDGEVIEGKAIEPLKKFTATYNTTTNTLNIS